ncbi:MAG: helix-turn-helix domain-containing protein [Lentisphaerae bacterium]|nr:helix-turn-helix domain-containing protein [Lentisphaerota bacterium]
MLELDKIRLRSVFFSAETTCQSLPCPATVVEEVQGQGYRMPLTNPYNIPKSVGGQLTFTLSGCGILKVGSKEFECRPGTAFLYSDSDPQVAYYVPECSKKRWHFIWINFTGESSENLIREINSAYGYFFANPNPALEKILTDYLQYAGATLFISQLEGAKIFFDLVNELGCGSSSTSTRNSSQSICQEVKNEIASAFYESISTSSLARRIGVSREHMSRIFHKETGRTLRNFRAEQQLGAAMNLLLKSNCSCKEIAQYCNYGSYSSFYRAFMAVYHISPEAFRKNHASTDARKNGKQ